MTQKDAILYSLESTKNFLLMYLKDLSDADLLVRPAPTANHLAWQIGHLINSEINLLKRDLPGLNYPTLPDGFADAHSKKTASSDTGFYTRDQYIDLFEKARNCTTTIVRILPEGELDKPSEGPLAQIAPTIGELFLLIANHTLLHAGQFTVTRRVLGKPVLF